MSVDWSKPLELNDGTPVRLVHTCSEDGSIMSGWRDVMLDGPDSHTEFRSAHTIRSFKKDGQNPIYSSLSVRNRSMIDPKKPLQLLTGSRSQDVELLGTALAGELIVNTYGTGKDGHWIVFDLNGKFVRSTNGGGRALTLRNKPEEVVHRFKINVTDGVPYFTPLSPNTGELVDLQVTIQEDKVVRVLTNVALL